MGLAEKSDLRNFNSTHEDFVEILSEKVVTGGVVPLGKRIVGGKMIDDALALTKVGAVRHAHEGIDKPFGALRIDKKVFYGRSF